MHEIHLYSIKYGVENKFVKIKDLVHRVFKIISLNQGICVKASYLRRDYKLPEVDALILASAIYTGYKHFYTFDKDFENLDNIRIEKTIIHYLK